jgi:beta-glucosidase-like glycosyl hydrolase
MKSSLFPQLALALVAALGHHAAAADPKKDLAVQAGYHVIHSYPGLTPPASLLTLTEQGLVGGIILFSGNVGSNLADVIESFQSAYKKSPAYIGKPLIIMTDQEGGEVRRLPGGPDLSEKEVGESSNPSQAATTAGEQAASAITNSTANCNLAPVLDVFRQPGNFIDEFQRSYGNTSALVSECASAFIIAQQKAGVIATAKHFPGLGAATTSEDTDVEPVTINLTLEELQTIDEVPYVKAIADGVDMVMASWALYPALDAQRPSGLSTAWIQGQLRERLGFKGVTITDAIEAGALEAFGDDPNRAILATEAGMDIILASQQNATQGEAVVNGLVSALSAGTLSRTAFDKSTKRILALRAKIPA